MKKRVVLTAAGLLVIGNGAGQSNALPLIPVDPVEAATLAAALSRGSQQDLEHFLSLYPENPFLGTVLGKLIEGVERQNLDRSQARIWYAQYGHSLGSDQLQTHQQLTPPVHSPQQRQKASSSDQTLILVQRAARRFNSDVSRCDVKWVVDKFNKCIGDALGRFATDLASPKIDLPAPLKPIKNEVARAAREVRSAPTAKQARVAVEAVIAEVHKAIKLAEVSNDTVAADLGTRAGNVIAASLERVDSKLAQVEL